MHKHIKKFNFKHFVLKHNNMNILICNNTDSLDMLHGGNVNTVILFNTNYISNNFNSKDEVINYVKNKFLD
jgi:hypothetical protein